MVRVYFKNGHSAAVSRAAAADIEVIFQASTATDGAAGLVCKDKDGKVVGQFRLEDIIGYEVE